MSLQLYTPSLTGCRTFDASADGYGRGEGFCVCVLAPASATAASQAISYFHIASSAVNQDGRSSSLTAPNGPSQSRLITSALRAADMAKSQLGYVALHGTGPYTPRQRFGRVARYSLRLRYQPSVRHDSQALLLVIPLKSALWDKRCRQSGNSHRLLPWDLSNHATAIQRVPLV